MIANKIRYLRSCYQADLRAVSLLNFFGKKATHQLLLDSFEPVSGELKEFPISTEWAKKLESHMNIYGKEKALFCGAIFLAGTSNIAGKKETVLAPIFLYPTELLIDEDIYYVAIDARDPIINPAVTSAIENGQQGIYEALSDALPKGYLNFDAVDKMEKKLAKYFPEIDISFLQKLPQLLSESEKDEIIKKNKKNDLMAFIPMVGLCALKKPTGSRGILNELEEMALSSSFSKPIEILLGDKVNNPIGKTLKSDHVPALLSETQTAIVRDALKYPLRLVIGPPGTGKSFTIAALAIEMLARGKSVLIASKNVEAVDVVAEKIERDLGLENIVVRASRKGFRKAVQVRLKNLSHGFEFKDTSWIDIKIEERKLSKINNSITEIEKNIINQQDKLGADGSFLYEYAGGFFERLKMRWLKYQYGKAKPIWELITEMEQEISKKNKFLYKYIRNLFYFYLKQTFVRWRYEMNAMNDALRARTGNKKAELFEETNFDKVLKALPIWTVSTADVHKVFPLYQELFDLVIIDEATQCDISSSLPLLQRAKSVLIVGDPKQLRHLSFLSKKQQGIFAKQHDISFKKMEQLDYREKSLLDFVDEKIPSQDSVYFLNEHYRSMPGIISFSNKQFYAGHLNIMTDTLNVKSKRHNFIEHLNGKRNAKGFNQIEAEVIFERILKLAESEAGLEKQFCQTIGVVSPFRDQIDYMQRMADKALSPSVVERHRVMIGTPFSFQGEERDIVYISFVLDGDSHPSAFHYLNRGEVFNVSITRARVRQFNCISFPIEKVNANHLLGRYLAHVNEPKSVTKKEYVEKLTEPFMKEVINAISLLGYKEIIRGYEMGGVLIDLIVLKNSKCFGIDLIGYPGEYEDALSLEQWKMINRIGVPVFYLPYSDWFFDQEKSIAALKAFLGV